MKSPPEKTATFVVVRGPIPTELSRGNLYVNPQGNRAHHLCACGCGSRVLTPLNHLEWSLAGPDDAPSLHPSVGNWNLECRSHYVVRNGKVIWARTFTPAEIAACRAKDLKPYLQTSWREKIGNWVSRTVERLRSKWK